MVLSTRVLPFQPWRGRATHLCCVLHAPRLGATQAPQDERNAGSSRVGVSKSRWPRAFKNSYERSHPTGLILRSEHALILPVYGLREPYRPPVSRFGSGLLEVRARVHRVEGRRGVTVLRFFILRYRAGAERVHCVCRIELFSSYYIK